MSVKAIDYVLGLKIPKATDKLVMLCLANYADENGCCYPSQTRLAEVSSLDRKTIIRSLSTLVLNGYLEDTGQRVGNTKQIVVFRIIGIAENEQELNSPKNGTVPKTEQSRFSRQTVPFFPVNSPKFPGKQSQKRDTEPLYNHQGTVKEPSVPIPPDIPPDLWKDFLHVRKKLKAVNSDRAIRLLLAELTKLSADGYPPTAIIEQSVRNSWKDFYPLKTASKPEKRISGRGAIVV